MKIIKVIVYCTVVLIFTACVTDNEEEAQNPKSVVDNKYTDNNSGIILQFPQAWTVQIDVVMGNNTLDLMATAPSVGGFSSNVNVISLVHSGTSDMNVVINEVKPQLQSQFPDINFLHDTVYVEESTTFGELVYTVNIGGTDLKYNQTLFINRNYDIIITYTDTRTHFDVNQEIPQIQNSLVVF